MTAYCLHCMEPLQEGYPCPSCGATTAPANATHQLPAGTLLNNSYLVGRAIGQGGFGITYIARDVTLDAKVAIKEYFLKSCSCRTSQNSTAVTVSDEGKKALFLKCKQRFLDEARILERYRYERGIVNVRGYFEGNNTAYIVMEYLDGKSLQSIVHNQVLPASWVFSKFQPVMDALERMHADGVIHRDVSPDNIMLLKDDTLCLMDFGAARRIDEAARQGVTIMHKAGYAPPEQYESGNNLGPWTDIYALCATMYRCITGVKPAASVNRQGIKAIKTPSELGFRISKTQEAVLMRGMCAKPADRFQNIAEMRAAMQGQLPAMRQAVNKLQEPQPSATGRFAGVMSSQKDILQAVQQGARQVSHQLANTKSRISSYSKQQRPTRQSHQAPSKLLDAPKRTALAQGGFCPRCGHRLIPGQPCPVCQENKRRRFIIGALATILAVLLVALVVILSGTLEGKRDVPHTGTSQLKTVQLSSEAADAISEKTSRNTSGNLPDTKADAHEADESSGEEYETGEEDAEDEDEDEFLEDGDEDDSVADAFGWTNY